MAEDDTSGINLTSLKAELDDHQSIKIDIIEAFMPYRSTLPYGDLGKTEIVRNPQGDYTLMIGIVGGKGLHLTGSLAELTTYVSRWQAVTLNAPSVDYASISNENPSIAINWLICTGPGHTLAVFVDLFFTGNRSIEMVLITWYMFLMERSMRW